MIFLVLFQVFSVCAQTVTENDLKGLQKKLGGLSSLSADFSQVRFFHMRPDLPVPSSGKVYFAKSGKFRWNLDPKKTQKTGDILLFDLEFLYQISNNEGPKFPPSSSRVKELLRIADLVLDFSTLMKDYRVTASERQKNLLKLELVPKITSTEIENITVKIDSNSGYIQYLKMFFTNKNSSSFDFSNFQVNSVLEAVFKLPPHIKVFPGL